jgi:putative SOS response-associated peptidase YedK
MRWGLILPCYHCVSRQPARRREVPSIPNARAETIVSKPIFPAAFMRGRCLIRASGYYE